MTLRHPDASVRYSDGSKDAKKTRRVHRACAASALRINTSNAYARITQV